MNRMIALSAMLAFIPCPAPAGMLLDAIHGTSAQNGIIVLVQGGDDICEDAAASEFTVLALDTRPERVDALRERCRDRGIYGRVSTSLFDGKTIPCIDEPAHAGTVSAFRRRILELLTTTGDSELAKYAELVHD